jgi:hypothetical protein
MTVEQAAQFQEPGQVPGGYGGFDFFARLFSIQNILVKYGSGAPAPE